MEKMLRSESDLSASKHVLSVARTRALYQPRSQWKWLLSRRWIIDVLTCKQDFNVVARPGAAESDFFIVLPGSLKYRDTDENLASLTSSPAFSSLITTL